MMKLNVLIMKIYLHLFMKNLINYRLTDLVKNLIRG